MPADGTGFTNTFTLPVVTLLHPATETPTEYVPAIAIVDPLLVGFWEDEVKPPGPVQLYVAPAIVLAVRLIVFPAQTGLLEPATGAAGIALTVR